MTGCLHNCHIIILIFIHPSLFTSHFSFKGDNDFKLEEFLAGTPETFEPHYGKRKNFEIEVMLLSRGEVSPSI